LVFSASTPPFRKNVTCAYFSVSAVWSCFRPCSARTSARTSLGVVLGNATLHLERGVVLRQRDEVDELGRLLAREPLEVGIREGARHLAGAVGTEVEEDHRVAVVEARRGRSRTA
jgi:hypothetical protein